jgi:catechol 2,3-dioxygenase-like lactoylglutathione lyase family enzyme
VPFAEIRRAIGGIKVKPEQAPLNSGTGQRPGIESISAVTLATHDMARAVQFYRALGFDLHYGDEQSAFSSLRAGASYLNLLAQPAEPPSTTAFRPGTLLAWKVSQQSEGPSTTPGQASHSLPIDSNEPASSMRCPNFTEVKRPVAG